MKSENTGHGSGVASYLANLRWPEGKKFAFTVFDDPDGQSFETGAAVYGLLRDLGIYTTKGVWPVRGPREPSDPGITCGDSAEYVKWLLEFQQSGFEIGYHNATSHTSYRGETIAGLDRFRELFGHNPQTMAQHYFCDENIYWAEDRLTGLHRTLYNVLTRGARRNATFGGKEGHPYYWGDYCSQRVTYLRNFVFGNINTIKSCPWMPYHDPARPLVNYWYSSSEGANVNSFVERICEENQDSLEAEGGCCIMYTHFGHGFYANGSIHPRFKELITRISRKNGWFVPVGTLLNYLKGLPRPEFTDKSRAALERHWLYHKIRFGTA